MIKLLTSRLPVILLLAFSLTILSCGTSEKKVSEEPTPGFDQAEDQAEFVINGESDTATAGDLQTVHFPFDSSRITPNSKDVLQQNAELLKQNPDLQIQIEGHADERGSIQYNLALGERRAKAVKNYMVGLGVSGDRMTIVSFGKEKPIAYGHNEQAWAQNRRANFVITGI
ncbi:MAG: peptidoglycan-associated lipoprotein Pal [Bacteriovoracia bacterium]